MNAKGWRPFWAALLAGLLVLVPLVGGTVLLTRRTLRTKLASRPQSGVAIRSAQGGKPPEPAGLHRPHRDDSPRLPAALPQRQPELHPCAGPARGADRPLRDGRSRPRRLLPAAGPARCREALLSALALPEDTHYLALAPSVLQAIADRYGALRVGFSGALTADELARTGCSANVQALSAREAEALLSGMEGVVPPGPAKAAARAAVWDAFFRQELELLPATLPDALRTHSPSLLTDLTAQDLLILEDTLEFLADRTASVHAGALPGDWDADAGRYTLTEDSRAAVQALFNVSPTDGQLSSASEP